MVWVQITSKLYFLVLTEKLTWILRSSEDAFLLVTAWWENKRWPSLPLFGTLELPSTGGQVVLILAILLQASRVLSLQAGFLLITACCNEAYKMGDCILLLGICISITYVLHYGIFKKILVFAYSLAWAYTGGGGWSSAPWTVLCIPIDFHANAWLCPGCWNL